MPRGPRRLLDRSPLWVKVHETIRGGIREMKEEDEQLALREMEKEDKQLQLSPPADCAVDY